MSGLTTVGAGEGVHGNDKMPKATTSVLPFKINNTWVHVDIESKASQAEALTSCRMPRGKS